MDHCMETVFRRGIINNYSTHTELTSAPHGYIDVAKSVKKGVYCRGKLFCDYDLYDINTYQNMVIHSVIVSMQQSYKLNKQICSKLKTLNDKMIEIPLVKLNSIRWNLAEYKGRDKEYGMALNICKLYVEGMLPSVGESRAVRGFLNDSKEHKLFEDFVRGYFEIEHREIFRSLRQLDWAVTGDSCDYLPGMEMDLLLKKGNKVIILDTKCYGAILSGKHDTKRLHSPNLYQMNAYLQNWCYKHNGDLVSGILLYAKTTENFESCETHLLGHKIYIKTLDCTGDWNSIATNLNNIAILLK